jgi:hypothetical protein
MDSSIDATSDAGTADAVVSEEISECAFCSTPLHSSYFLLDALPACEACRYRQEEESRIGPGTRGLLRASAAGFGAAVAGSLLYWAVIAMTDREYAILAIVVGLMVGGAVRWGSRGKGGRACQAIAVILTYMAIVTSYLPMALEQLPDLEKPSATATQPATAPAASGGPNPAPAKAAKASVAEEPLTAGTFVLGILALLAFAALLPFFAGLENIVGLLIIGIGLWQAWKMNQRKTLEITGPFRVGSPPASATPA